MTFKTLCTPTQMLTYIKKHYVKEEESKKVLQIGLKKHNFASCLGKDTSYDKFIYKAE